MIQYIKNLKYIGDRPIRNLRICGRRDYDIEINSRTNEIRFRLQYAPRSQIGDQGVDIQHVMIFALEILKGRQEAGEELTEAIDNLTKSIAAIPPAD